MRLNVCDNSVMELLGIKMCEGRLVHYVQIPLQNEGVRNWRPLRDSNPRPQD